MKTVDLKETGECRMIDDKWIENWLVNRLGPNHTFNIQFCKNLIRDVELLIREDERDRILKEVGGIY